MERQLPADIQAERAVLGACLLASTTEPEAIRVIFQRVSIDDFYLERHAWIARAIVDLVDQRVPPDEVTLFNELRKRDQLDSIGGVAYIMDLVNSVPSLYYGHHYAKVVAETAARRRLIETGGHITALAYDETRSLEDLHAEVRTRLELEQQASRAEPGWKQHTTNSHVLYHKHFEKRTPVVETILPQGTFLLVGKPKAKKSWLALDIALAVACGGKALGHFQAWKGEALYVDLEMGQERIRDRLHAASPYESTPKELHFATEWPPIFKGCEEWIEQWMEEHPFTRLIVFDTQVGIRPPRGRNVEPYEHEKAYMQRLSNICHQFNIGILLVHHSRKADASDVTDDSLGSNGLVGGVDNFASLKRDPNRKNGGILQARGRDIRQDDDLLLTWDTMLAQWNFTPEAQQDVTPERQKILELLEAQPGLFPKQIAEHVGSTEGGVRQLLLAMRRAGQVLLDEGRYYTLMDMGKKANAA